MKMLTLGKMSPTLIKSEFADMMKILYIITGAPGTGKTTLALALALANEKSIFEADKFPGIYNANGIYVWGNQQESHEWNFTEFQEAVVAGRPLLVVSNTSMKRKFYENFLNFALKNGYIVQKLNTEAIIHPDGTLASSIHNVPSKVVDRMRLGYEPYVHQIKNPWHSNEPIKDVDHEFVLRLLDRDRTLIFAPQGGIPKLNNMSPIPGIGEIVAQWKKEGDPIAVVSNQAGIFAGHKTVAELLEEAKAIEEWFPIDLQLYCPNYEGDKCLAYLKGSNRFIEIIRGQDNQSFRKPQAGMIEAAMAHFPRHRYDLAEMIGNATEDYLAALAANLPYRHIHDVLYP